MRNLIFSLVTAAALAPATANAQQWLRDQEWRNERNQERINQEFDRMNERQFDQRQRAHERFMNDEDD